MSFKRSRAAYEADQQATQAPFVVYGTPLPPHDADARDDGSYVPVWKQEVRDERGRKRLHGAFTGGWSAGYFNTVGSKEGWTPSTFMSSRSNRRKDDKSANQQRPEDFMDEEDIADAEESRRIQTSQAFAGLGAADNGIGRTTGLAGLFHVQGETMGTKLLKKMGWKEGQGIGPKVRRRAKLDLGSRPESEDTYHFAPDNVAIIGFLRKADRRGLGYEGESRLGPLESLRSQLVSQEDDLEDEDGLNLGRPTSGRMSKKKDKKPRGGIGIGVLNDTGSDDEDPYEIGPRISYNKAIGGPKSKKKKTPSSSTSVNPSVKSKPVFIPKRNSLSQAPAGLRKCHDGRPPLEGFVLAQNPDPIISMITVDGKYPPPKIPPGWKSSKKPEATTENPQYTSTAEAAKTSQLNPTARAALLGEKPLPGKSVFDFLSPAARDRVATVTGKANLPQAKGEVPEGYALSEEEKRRNLLDRIPTLDKQSALGAMERGASGGGPYRDNENKRARYRGYLELQAGLRSEPPDKPATMTTDEWMQELHEFYNVARIFRPMTGSMASRFTTSSTTSNMVTGSDGKVEDAGLLSKPLRKPEDPAEAAAKMNMYGPMTRTIRDFHPSRLLCKRFNVKPPAHVQAKGGMSTTQANKAEAVASPVDYLPKEVESSAVPQRQGESTVDMSRNEALEGKRPGEEVFKAIFGDSSDEENLVADPIRRGLTPVSTSVKLSAPQDSSPGRSTSTLGPSPSHSNRRTVDDALISKDDQDKFGLPLDEHGSSQSSPESPDQQRSPPPQYPASEASASTSASLVSYRTAPPPFSSLFVTSSAHQSDPIVTAAAPSAATTLDSQESLDPDLQTTSRDKAPAPAYEAPTASGSSEPSIAYEVTVAETKRVLPKDTKAEGSSRAKDDDVEPPPAYSEGYSPLLSFSYLMAAAGGAASIITQVQQGGPPINTIGDVGADETITMDLRGTRFVLSRDELLTLPEFVLLSLFPNGLFPEGHMGGSSEGDAVQVDYDPESLQYMLDFFRNVASSIPTETSPSGSQDGDAAPGEPLMGASRDDSSKRAGIIVLREDLDFYVIPPKSDIQQPEMIEVKRAASRALLKQDGIFSGLKRSDEPGTTEAHLIEMLTAGGFNHDDKWGHRAGEPGKAVVCSLALARLRSDIRGNDMGSNAVGMAQKLLLFWRKPARRCWWEGVELDDVEGVNGKLKVWIRRVWTLEMSVIGLR